MRKANIFTILIALGMVLLTACTTTVYEPIAEAPPSETEALAGEVLAGFIESQGSTLYITPVEVFMLYDADSGYARNYSIPSVEFIERNDTQRFDELELTVDDFPSGYHIRPNWHADLGWHYVEQAGIETLSFEIDDETEFVFVDSRLLFDTDPIGSRLRITNVQDEFLQYLYPTVVHFVEVDDGRVIRVVQEFGFTM